MSLPMGDAFDLGWFGMPVTLLWIVGVTNAMNLLDGIDGLAAGVTILAAIAFLLIGATTGTPAYVAVGAGATIGAIGSASTPASPAPSEVAAIALNPKDV